MNKEILLNLICSGNVLQSQSLNAEEKRTVYALMDRYGLPMSTCYRRFFEKGFSQWEIEGITRLKSEFIRSHEDELKAVKYRKGRTAWDKLQNVGEIKPGLFYDQLKVAKLANLFKAFMLCHGMCAVTSYKRFVSDDWQEWEKKGVQDILTGELTQ